MRVWNLVVRDVTTVLDLAMHARNDLLFKRACVTARRVKVGDTVRVHNYYGGHRVATRVVVGKKMYKNAPPPGVDVGQLPLLQLQFKNGKSR